MLVWVFWICVFLLFYTYIGYPIVLWLLSFISGKTNQVPQTGEEFRQTIGVIICAFNEQDIISKKLENTFLLDYPLELIEVVVVTDGSNDNTAENVKDFQKRAPKSFFHLHDPERRGKISAMNRGVEQLRKLSSIPDLTVFTDANSQLSPESLKGLAKFMLDPGVGGVSGVKKMSTHDTKLIERMYWHYESNLKTLEDRFQSVIGMVGELFCVRTSVYPDIPEDTIIEDLEISMNLLSNGYSIRYSDEAVASETDVISSIAELSRKQRIAAGGYQLMSRMSFRRFIHRPMILFQFFSHRICRWLIAPMAIIVMTISSMIWLYQQGHYTVLISIVIIFLVSFVALVTVKSTKTIISWPAYLYLTQLNQLIGLLNLVTGKQSVLWKKVRE